MEHGQHDSLAQYSQSKLQEILEYARVHCRYYGKLFDALGFLPEALADFDSLPLLDKRTVRERKNDLISDEIDRLDYYNMNTGGSTGEPLEFPVSTLAGRVDTMHQDFLYKIMGYESGDKIFTFFGRSVSEECRKENEYWIRTGKTGGPFGELTYSSLYLSQETLPYYVRHLCSQKPTILRGYPSAIGEMATYLLQQKISLSFQVKGVQLTAENAYDWQIAAIEDAFDTKVFLQYGHSEVCVFGYTTDDTHAYICSPVYGLTEVVGSDGKSVANGEVGEIVVTGFYNRALPLIRYRTGDLAIYGGTDDGIVKLDRIVGRTQDFVYDVKDRKIPLTALVFGQHFGAFRNIRRWQIVQDVPGKILVRIVKDDAFSAKDVAEIKAKFWENAQIEAQIESAISIPLTERGKSRFLVQHLS
jgi:phenylacetate-CoA ligase